MNENGGFHWDDFDIPDNRYILVVSVWSHECVYYILETMPCRSLNPVVCFFCIDFWSLVTCSKRHQTPTIQLRFEPDKSILTCTKWDIKPWFCVRDGYVWIFWIWFQSCIPDADSFKKVGLLCCWCYLENAIFWRFRNRKHQLRLVVYPFFTSFRTSHVVQDFFHQQ